VVVTIPTELNVSLTDKVVTLGTAISIINPNRWVKRGFVNITVPAP